MTVDEAVNDPAPSNSVPGGMSLIGMLGIGLSLGLVVLLALSLDLPAVGRALGRASWLPLAGATLVYCLLFPLRGLRWRLLLEPLASVSTGLASQGFLIGFMANNLLPARLGDVVRALVLARKAQVPRSATFATVLLERVFDGLTVVFVLALSLAAVPLEASPERSLQLRGVAAVLGLVFGGTLLVAVLLAANESKTLTLAERVLTPAPEPVRAKLLAILVKLASGLHVLRSGGHTAVVLALSLLVWTLEVVVYVGVADALGISASFLGLALVMSILSLGLTAPSAPGFVGVFEALVIPGLGLLGVQVAEAAAFALILHAIHYLPGTVLGLLAAWTSGLGLKEVLGGSKAT